MSAPELHFGSGSLRQTKFLKYFCNLKKLDIFVCKSMFVSREKLEDMSEFVEFLGAENMKCIVFAI